MPRNGGASLAGVKTLQLGHAIAHPVSRLRDEISRVSYFPEMYGLRTALSPSGVSNQLPTAPEGSVHRRFIDASSTLRYA